MWRSTGVCEAEDGATEDSALRCGRSRTPGGDGSEKSAVDWTVAGVSAARGDSALEEELAIRGVEENLAGSGGSKAASEAPVEVREQAEWMVEQCTGVDGLSSLIRILERGGIVNGENEFDGIAGLVE
jgi:hypothetical protein